MGGEKCIETPASSGCKKYYPRKNSLMFMFFKKVECVKWILGFLLRRITRLHCRIFITITRRTWALYSRKRRRQKDAPAELGRNYVAATELSEETTARKVNNATIAVDYTLSCLARRIIPSYNLINLICALCGLLKKISSLEETC